LEQTVRAMEPVKADLRVSLDAIHRALDNLPEAQINDRATRSMHAAAFSTGRVNSSWCARMSGGTTRSTS
jgi:formate dehydrogenase assembly factor FdhD